MAVALSACATARPHADAAAGTLAPDSPHRIARSPATPPAASRPGQSTQVFDSNFAFDIDPHSSLASLQARIGVSGIQTAADHLHWDGLQDSALDADLQDGRLRRIDVTSPDNSHLFIDMDTGVRPSLRAVSRSLAAPDAPTHAAVAAVLRWAAAWSARDLSHYLAAYAPDFRGSGASRSQWVLQRRHHLLAARHIQVQVIDPQVQLVGEDRARIQFEQRYRAVHHRDDTRKVLEMWLVNGNWLIVGETAS